MRKLKLFFACLLMTFLSIGQMWGETYTLGWGTASGTAGTYTNFTAKNGSVSNIVSFDCAQNQGTTAPTYNSNNNDLRLYYHSGGNGGSITLTPAANVTITGAVLTSSTSPSVKYSVNGGTATSVTASNNSYTVSGISATSSLTFQNVNTSNTQLRIKTIQITYSVSGTAKPTVSLDPDGGNFTESVEVTITPSTGATAYYTTDATKKTTPSTTTWTAYNGSAKPTFTETTTIWVASVKDATWSDVVEKTFTKVTPVTSYDIDFETNDLSLYVNWDFSNIGIRNTIARRSGGGNYYGANVNSGGNGTATCSITTKSKIAAPGTLTFYISKESGNTTASSWKAEVSSDGSDWTEVETFDAKSMSSGTWNECAADLSEYSNVYVRISYGSSSAIRTIDDISLVMASGIAKPTITGEDNFLTSTEVTMSCTTDGAAIYYTTTESAKATPATSGDWTAYNGASKPSFSATTTVWAAAKKNDAWSAVAEKTFTKATILTVAEALTIIEGLDNKTATTAEYYVSGVVSTVTALTVDGTGEYYISADGTKTSELQVYKGKWVGGANFTSTDQLIEGDDVTIKGKLKKYNSYKELDQNNEVVAYKLKARLAWAGTTEGAYDASLEGVNTFPTLTNTNGVDVEYSSSNGAAATIDPSTGAISLAAVGQTTITASFAGNASYKANSASYTLNIASSLVTLTYNVDGGEPIDPINVTALPNPLPTTTKAGKNFGGWFTDSEKTEPAVPGTAISENTTLFAKWLDPYTVAEALAIIDAMDVNGETDSKVYVAGIITPTDRSFNNTYKSITYMISDDGTATDELKVYSGKGVSDVDFTAVTDLEDEDQVVVYGKLKKYQKNTNPIEPEMNQPNYIYSLSRKAEAGIEWGVASFDAYIGQSNTFPTLTNPNSLTVAYSSTNTTAATIDPATGDITLGTTPNVSTIIKATFAGNAGYKEAEVSYTLNVYNPTNPGTITYEENGGSTVADVTTPVDNFPDPLPTPTKENNIFAGWWTTSTFNDGTQAVAGAPMDGNVILYAKWTEIPVWAYTYTSNVTLSTAGGTSASAAKVKFYGEEGDGYDAIKAGTGSAQGAVVVNVPAGATALHFHAYSWYNETVELTVTAPTGVTVSPATEISINKNTGIKENSPFTLAEGSDPKTDAYYAVSLSGNTEATNITISATSGKRFVFFGVNQEGGVLPVLDNIAISGDLDNKSYKAGQSLDMTGLTVEATYTLGGTPQTPVDITNDPGLTWTYDPLVENQDEVTVTAHFGDPEKTASKTIEGLTVTTADPKIYVSTLNVNFASVEVGESVPAAQTITVNLTNIASVTATLGGTNPEAFSISKTEGVVDGDEITISLLANTDAAASYSATLTISDGAEGAEDKTINLSFAVTEPVVEDDVTGTWTLVTNATTLAAGKKVIIAQYVDADGAINTMAGQATNNRSVIASTVAGTTLTPAVGTKVMTLADAGEGNFYLKTSDGEYLYNASSSTKSYLRTKAEDEDASWTIAVDAEGVATITSVENTNRTKMRYNPNTSGSPLFNCYATGQNDIALYMLEEDTPEPPTPAADYTRNVTNGHYGTICLPKAGTIEGATLYEIGSFESNMIYVDEVGTTLAAGVPYIFYASEAQLNVYYTDKTADDVPAGNANGLFGFYNLNDEDATYDIPEDAGNYILYNDQYWLVSGRAAYIANYRAYIKLGSIVPKAAAPGRRRVAMNVNGEQVATGFENLNASEKPVKLMIDGNIYILRGEKMYNVNGQLVK